MVQDATPTKRLPEAFLLLLRRRLLESELMIILSLSLILPSLHVTQLSSHPSLHVIGIEI